MEPDSTGLDAGLNPYIYAGDNPVMNTDPSGLDWMTPIGTSELGGISYQNYNQNWDLGNSCSVNANYNDFTYISGATGSYSAVIGEKALEDVHPEYWLGAGVIARGVVSGVASADAFVSTSRVVMPEMTWKSSIGSTGKIGEDYLKTLGGQSQAYFSTSQGGRYVDQLVDGIANESKVGYTSLTSGVRTQIAKDAELIKSRDIDGATWNFFTSPVTGKGGPSAQLRQALNNAGIKIKEHY